MIINLLPEHIIIFFNIALLVAFIALYALYFRHVMAKNKRLSDDNLSLISAVNDLVLTMNKAIEQNLIERAIAESHDHQGEPKIE